MTPKPGSGPVADEVAPLGLKMASHKEIEMNVDTRMIGGGTIRLTRNAHGSVTALDIASGWAVSVPPALFNQSTTDILEEVERLLSVGR